MFEDLIEKTDLFIFDLDGTIVDLSVDWEKMLADLKGKFGNKAESIRGFLDTLKSHDRKRALKIVEKYELERIHSVKANKDMVAFIKKIPGEVPLVIFSTNTKTAIQATLEKVGLKERFRFIISSDDVEKLKPDPGRLNMIIRRLGIKKEDVVYLGDRGVDLEAGRRAGIKTFLVGRGMK